ncbi:hypothetical protein C8J56DRAFT_1102229 [Mycena floridula]|nr:hypothetical protein C8J56DRAFT_1102229 [Mycena floridula]
MFPASLAHTLTGNTFGDIEGDLLSHNTHICIHTGERTCIHTVQEGQGPGISIPAGIPIAHKHDLRFLRSPSNGSDLVAREMDIASMSPNIGEKSWLSRSTKARTLSSHPTILQTVAVCRAPRTPFLVFSMESDSLSIIPISLGGFKSLVYYLADALSRSEQESLVAGAQLIRDVSAGLDHLSSIEQSPALSRFIFDLLVDENNNICIAVGLSEQVDTDVQVDGYLSVFQSLILKSFLEANNQHHIDKEWAITAGDFGQALDDSSSDDRDFLVQLESEPTEIVDLTSIEIASREYVFIPDRASDSFSLSAISTDYTHFIRRINPNNASSTNFQRCRHKGPNKSKTVAHRCPGYRRDEVTLGTSVSRTAIIQHLTPSLREICPVCKQLVEDGMFKCSCGQEDDGSSPTIQCSRCLVWSHHKCHQPNDSGSNHQPFTCFSCQESNNFVATETTDNAALFDGSSQPLSDSNDTSPREHSFVEATFTKPMVCRVCLLKTRKSAVLCSQCSFITHSQCARNAPPPCDRRAQLLLYAQYADRGKTQGTSALRKSSLVEGQPLSNESNHKGDPTIMYPKPLHLLRSIPMSNVSYVLHNPQASTEANPTRVKVSTSDNSLLARYHTSILPKLAVINADGHLLDRSVVCKDLIIREEGKPPILIATETANNTARQHRRSSSRRTLTQVLELAREAVQLDLTGHPEEAVMAYGRSVFLLNKVMEGVRGRSSGVSSKKRNGRPRSGIAQEAELRRLRRLQNIHDTYADRMYILCIAYSIPIPYPTSSGQARSSSHLYASTISQLQMSPQMSNSNHPSRQSRRSRGALPPALPPPANSLPPVPLNQIVSLQSRRSRRASALPPALPPPATSLPPLPSVEPDHKLLEAAARQRDDSVDPVEEQWPHYRGNPQQSSRQPKVGDDSVRPKKKSKTKYHR